jgi:hypothetical protein
VGYVLVSQGPANWASEQELQKEYEAMADFQRDAVCDLIKECADKYDNLVGFLVFGNKAKTSILEG